MYKHVVLWKIKDEVNRKSKKELVKEVMKNRIVCIVLFSLFIVFETFAQADIGIGSLSLNGNWEIIFDDNNEGVDDQWHLDKNYDNNTGKKQIEVPSCWEEFEKDYEGVAFYRKKFFLI